MKKIVVLALTLSLAFMYSCVNESTPPASGTSEPKNESADKGKAIYVKICQACHQANGEGVPGAFPPLAKSDFLASKEAAILQVLNGKTGEITVNGQKYNSIMPAQGTALNDADIAAVLNYVYASFGNDDTRVTSDEVKEIRGKK